MPQEHEIDGWKIVLSEPRGSRKTYHVEAHDGRWGRHAEHFGMTAIEALEGLADKTGLDRQELLATFS